MKKIIIIDNSNLNYDGNDINGEILRGTETSLIFLANEFCKKGFYVDFINNVKNEKTVNGVNYLNYSNKEFKKKFYHLAIAVSDANYFKNINSKKKALFSVSNQPVEKFLRKKQLFPFIRYKPIVVTLCNYQFKKRSYFTSFFGKKTIPITVDPEFYYTKINENYLPQKKVLYNIRSNRNLDQLIDIWVNKIFPKDKESIFHITPGLIDNVKKLSEFNVFERRLTSRKNLIDDLKEYRALLYLGHKSDIFTLTAEEAIKCCVPVVTYGIGSLSDRVSHNKSGFIVKNEDEFAEKTLNLLNKDQFYLDLKKQMFKSRSFNSWSNIADQWIETFLND